MKISPLFTGLLLASATTSKNQAEAGLPLGQFAAPVSRGALTGAICVGVKNIVSGLHKAIHQDVRIQDIDLNFEDNSQHNTRHSPADIVKKAIQNFPVNFSSNAVATTYVDIIFGVAQTGTIKNLQQLVLPVACMGMTQEILSEAPMPQQSKDALAYCASLVGALIQGKEPVATGLTISGFVAGVSLAKSFGNKGGANTRDLQKNTLNKSKSNPGVSASAASGFMAPQSSKTPDRAAAAGYDNYIRERYGLKEGENFWTGPDGSTFLPY